MLDNFVLEFTKREKARCFECKPENANCILSLYVYTSPFRRALMKFEANLKELKIKLKSHGTY